MKPHHEIVSAGDTGRSQSAQPTPTRVLRSIALLLSVLILGPAELVSAQHRTSRPSTNGSASSARPSGGGGSASSQRTAVPRGGGSSGSAGSAHRRTGVSPRPPGGGGYYPPHYPGHYPGYYPGYGGGWGTWGPSWSVGVGFGWGWPGPYYSYWGYPVGGVAPYGVVITRESTTGTYQARPQGSIDFKIKPKKAGIYIDGNYVGIADQFDGFPRYLWLPAGEHRVTLHIPGYENFDTVVEVLPGKVTELKVGLVEGMAVKPYVSGPTVASATQAARPPTTGPSTAMESRDLRSDPSEIALSVRPADASVYLDGKFIGTGGEVSARDNLLVDAGNHRLQVLHPDYDVMEQVVTIASGERLEVKLDLLIRDPI